MKNVRFYIPTHQPAHNTAIHMRVYMHLCMLTRHSNLLTRLQSLSMWHSQSMNQHVINYGWKYV